MMLLGFALLWLGTLTVVGVAWHRARRGAWSAEAFLKAPSRSYRVVLLAVGGLVVALAGLGLMLWGRS